MKSRREYKKKAPFRDAKTFLIIAEGEREDGYFSFFNEVNRRIIVHIIPREPGKSAPKHFIERLRVFEESEEYSPKDNDTLWFVLDIDRWQRSHIDELIEFCKSGNGKHVVISNPCFEVWLHNHISTVTDNDEDCGTLKNTLNSKTAGGYNKNSFCGLIATAINNSRNADTNPEHIYPHRMQTKVYKLAENLLALLGKNW